MRRAHDPARLGGRGRQARAEAQQQRGDPGGLRGQCELAAGDEIELARIAKDFQHDGAERIAGQRIRRAAQRGLDIGGAHGDQTARIRLSALVRLQARLRAKAVAGEAGVSPSEYAIQVGALSHTGTYGSTPAPQPSPASAFAEGGLRRTSEGEGARTTARTSTCRERYSARVASWIQSMGQARQPQTEDTRQVH